MARNKLGMKPLKNDYGPSFNSMSDNKFGKINLLAWPYCCRLKANLVLTTHMGVVSAIEIIPARRETIAVTQLLGFSLSKL